MAGMRVPRRPQTFKKPCLRQTRRKKLVPLRFPPKHFRSTPSSQRHQTDPQSNQPPIQQSHFLPFLLGSARGNFITWDGDRQP